MENTDNLILEHLKRFQAGQERIERKLEEVNRRLANLQVEAEVGQSLIATYSIDLIIGEKPRHSRLLDGCGIDA